jgi:hypothetical protein
MAAATLPRQNALMFRLGVAVATGGLALTMGLQTALVVAAAPQPHSTAALAAAPAPGGSAPTSLGHFFGKATSDLAHTTPPGPQHGRVVSSFARSSNPSHTKGHRGHVKR